MSKELLLRSQDVAAPPIPRFRPDNPKLGITYKILSGVVVCVNLLCMKVIYEKHPDLGAA